MTVADLQQLLTSVSQILAAAGSKAAGEIDYLNQRLGTFKDQRVKAFADSLKAAPKPFKSVDEAMSSVQKLYDQALSPELSEEAIKEEVGRCEKMTKPQLEDLARRFGIEWKFAKKDQIVKAVEQRIIDRKGAFERSQI